MVLPFALSLLVSLLIVWTRSWHGKYSYDSLSGVQKVHGGQVPRVGGIAIFVGLCAADALAPVHSQVILTPLLLLASISFSFGLLEDLSKRVPVAMRLWATMIPGVVGYYLTGYTLNQFGYGWLDLLLQWPIISIAFTAFAICGVTHAMNMIDGFNGLAGWAATWILLGLIAIALNVGDLPVALVSTALLASTLGFLCVNWPSGKIFLGDGGAYLLGTSIAWLCVALVNRNSGVSPFALLVLCSYPIIEVLYSIARRLKNKMGSGQPDRLHLHQIIAGSLIYPKLKHQLSPTKINSITGFSVGTWSISSMVLATTFAQNQNASLAAFGCLVLVYITAYQWAKKRVAKKARQASRRQSGSELPQA